MKSSPLTIESARVLLEQVHRSDPSSFPAAVNTVMRDLGLGDTLVVLGVFSKLGAVSPLLSAHAKLRTDHDKLRADNDQLRADLGALQRKLNLLGTWVTARLPPDAAAPEAPPAVPVPAVSPAADTPSPAAPTAGTVQETPPEPEPEQLIAAALQAGAAADGPADDQQFEMEWYAKRGLSMPPPSPEMPTVDPPAPPAPVARPKAKKK